MKRVLFTQPIVATYRLPLFQLVHDKLAADGWGMTVVHAPVPEERKSRHDAQTAPWIHEVANRDIRIAGQRLYFRRVRAIPADLVVTELAAGNLNALAWAITGRKYLLWGHGKHYDDTPNRIADALERFMIRRSAGVLVYVPSGREYIIDHAGVEPDAVTAFMNTTDTETLRAVSAAATDGDLADFCSQNQLDRSAPTVLFVGGLDADKNIAFLAESVVQMIRERPNLQVIIGGRGADEHLVQAVADDHPGVHLLGYLDRTQLALAGRLSSLIICPGKIGLVAVDALALGLPIMTMANSRNAPEADYLEEGVDVITVTGGEQEFAAATIAALGSTVGFVARGEIPSLSGSAEHIVDAILRAAGRTGRGIRRSRGSAART